MANGHADFSAGDRVRVDRVFDPPHPMTGSKHAVVEGVLGKVDRFGFSLNGRFHSWNPGPSCTQTVVRLTPENDDRGGDGG
ncbi:hypothetical protein OG563_26700 [Nocardia vinacea]|uniref:DUF1918 domain-containing protein n=1 Tax=Nocardia vinacea TaxID=96468 RepID=A0ABZ1YKN6_9NOCA|nr:hypothetical protein [Nocardia vinacea]